MNEGLQDYRDAFFSVRESDQQKPPQAFSEPVVLSHGEKWVPHKNDE